MHVQLFLTSPLIYGGLAAKQINTRNCPSTNRYWNKWSHHLVSIRRFPEYYIFLTFSFNANDAVLTNSAKSLDLNFMDIRHTFSSWFAVSVSDKLQICLSISASWRIRSFKHRIPLIEEGFSLVPWRCPLWLWMICIGRERVCVWQGVSWVNWFPRPGPKFGSPFAFDRHKLLFVW